MRTIKYKPSDSREYSNYIDIGSCERDYDYINFYLPGENDDRSGKEYFESYESWYEKFLEEPIGAQMIIVNFYISEYMGWSNDENTPQPSYFADVYGEKTLKVLSVNLDYLLGFNDKWFEYQSSLFKGLDLDWDDIEDRFVSTKESEDAILTDIEFDDGSAISFLDDNDNVRSFYVPEEDYPILKSEMDKLVAMFRP